MPQVVIADTLITYEDSGSGPVILCVHGWMHDTSSYTELTEYLKDSHRVISVDLPNFGRSDMTGEVTTIEDYARFIAAFTKKLSLRTYSLVGHSMGGQIAIYAVAHNILTPEKLILIASAGARDIHRTSKVLMKTISKVVGRFIPKKFKQSFYKRIGSDYNVDLSDQHKKIIAEVLTTDVQEDAKKLQIPTLLVYGSLDQQTKVWIGERFEKLIPHAKLEVIDGGDHWVHQKMAPEVSRSLEEFLND